MRKYAHTYAYTYINAHICVHARVWVCVYTYVYMKIHSHIYIYIHKYAYIYVYIYIYIVCILQIAVVHANDIYTAMRVYLPNPMNHVKIFQGRPHRFGLRVLVPHWYRSFLADHFGQAEMNIHVE